MAAHSRKSPLKRVATAEDLALGIKKARIVPPDYKNKHNIGQRGTHVVTYNETLLHYRVMANACIEDSAVKQKMTVKNFIDKSCNKIAFKNNMQRHGVKASLKKSTRKSTSNESIIKFVDKISSVKNFKMIPKVKNSGNDCTVIESRKFSTTKKYIKKFVAMGSVKRSTATKGSVKRSVETKDSVKKLLAAKYSAKRSLASKDSANRPSAALKDSAKSPSAAVKDSANRLSAAVKDSANRPLLAVKDSAKRPLLAVKDSAKRPLLAVKDSAKRPLLAVKDSAKRPLLVVKDSAKRPLLAVKDSAKRPLLAVKDSAKRPLLAVKDSAKRPLLAVKDSAKRPLLAVKDSAKRPVAAAKDSAKRPAAAAKDSAKRPSAAAKDSAKRAAAKDSAKRLSLAAAKDSAKRPVAAVKDSAKRSAVAAKGSEKRLSLAKDSAKRSLTAKDSGKAKNFMKGTVAQGSIVKNSVKPSSLLKCSINHYLKKTSIKTSWKFCSKPLKKKISKTHPTIKENLFELTQGKKLSVCLIRLKREASLNAAAKVNLIYNENQQNSPEKQIRGSRSESPLKIKNPPILKNCQLFKTSKIYKSDVQSLSPSKDKVSTKKRNKLNLPPIKTMKSFIKKVKERLKREACIDKSSLLCNKTNDVATIQNKLKHVQNSLSSCRSPGNQTLHKMTKVKSNNSYKGFTKRSKWFNGCECSEDCIACPFETKDYLVDFVDKVKCSCKRRSKCQCIESCMNTVDNSTAREKNPDCFLQLTHNNLKVFSPQKNLLSKCIKVCQNEDIDLNYSTSKKQLESCFTDYGNLKTCSTANLKDENPLTVVTAQTTSPNSYQNLKNAMKTHNLNFDESSTALSLSSNLYDSKGQHQYRSSKDHCCTATALDFCQTKCKNHSREESGGKVSKRIASLNAQAIMNVCQESRHSKREFLHNSQRAARTHYIFSPKRQSCRWVDGLGMFLTNDLQNSSSNDFKQKIVVSCSTTSTNSNKVIGSNLSRSKNPPITSNTNCSPDIKVQTEIHRRIKQKSFEGGPKPASTQFSQRKQEMVSGCSSFPYMHGENVSPTQCQTFTLNGIGSISSLPYQPYASPFNVPCNHGSIPHCSYYSSESCYSHSSTMVQPIPKPCLITSPIPIHVPHAEVKVLIHSPHPRQPFVQTTADPRKLQKRKKGNQTIPKNKPIDSQQNTDFRKTVNIKSKCKLQKRNCDVKVCSEKEEKKFLPSKRKKTNSSNSGWSWEGEPEMKPVPNLNIDAPPIERKCYPAIKHSDGEFIHVRDCVLLRSGPRKKDLPYTAKVVAFWENTTDGEMMMSLLWYYRPEHTESGRQPHNIDCEIFASKHRDINSVACIEEKCYVLTFNEYCRYKAEVRRSESNIPARQKVVPASENYPRQNRLPPIDADPETVFLCRKVYHFRQKRILKN